MQVICNGEEVLTVSGTKERYVVDVWSGNHPFFKVCSLKCLPRFSGCRGAPMRLKQASICP